MLIKVRDFRDPVIKEITKAIEENAYWFDKNTKKHYTRVNPDKQEVKLGEYTSYRSVESCREEFDVNFSKQIHIWFYTFCVLVDFLLIDASWQHHLDNLQFDIRDHAWLFPFIIGIVLSVMTLFGIFITFFYNPKNPY